MQINLVKIKKVAELLQIEPQEIIEESSIGIIFQPNFNDHSINNGHFNYRQSPEEVFDFLKSYLQNQQELMQAFAEEMKENREELKMLFSLMERGKT